METFQLIISILSTIFTAVAAIASFYAAKAAAKSNKINIEEIQKRDKPVLDVPSKKFKGPLEKNLLGQWEEGVKDPLKHGAANYFLNLNNIGNAYARNVVMHFEYEGLDDFIALYSDGGWTYEDNILSFYLEKKEKQNFHFINFHHFSPKDEISNKIRLPIFPQYENLGTVQPSKYNTESTKIHIPLFYLLLLNINEYAHREIKLFDLFLVIEYTDPFDVKYKQKFSVKPHFNSVEITEKEMDFYGRVICEEVSA
ncbi:hypothetical protein [Bacillus subtilis]|uniref:hypothetical protein n=1 Tax=Bacillus subtilis TaxID=1423 RepID=UPI000B4B9825|nr:hypothetical protein [Bacillus subtilis]ASB93410.1 hypothetical protein S101392_01937 [Bacillus subtilis subsp. subtilis]